MFQRADEPCNSPPAWAIAALLGALAWLGFAASEALATPVGFTTELVEDDGSVYGAVFSIDSIDLDAQNTWIEEIDDFGAVVELWTYVWGSSIDAPLPFNGSAAYDPTSGELVGITTPALPAPGFSSTINLRLFVDGSWIANTCIPLETCNPDYLFGTYTVTRVVIPEPGSAPLLLAGLLAIAARPRSATRGSARRSECRRESAPRVVCARPRRGPPAAARRCRRGFPASR